MKKLFTLLTLGVMLFSTGAFAQKIWTGASSTNWNTAGNWSPVGAPTATDHVTIPSAPANQPVLSGISGVCNNLTVNAGATLTISGTNTSNALLTASGNTIIYGSLSVGSAISHIGSLTVNNITWASGSSMSGAINGGINVSGNWEFATGSAVSMGYSTVTFTGSNNSTITSNSSNSNFYGLVTNKTGGAVVYIGAASTSTLSINGAINIGAGAELMCQAAITTILKGNIVNAGNIYMNAGTISFERASGTQSLQINNNDYFNSVNINTGGTVTISTSYMMQIRGNLVIQSGVLDPIGSTIGLFGNWTNNVGTAGFTEGSGTVVFNGGNYHQYCSNETFNILEVNKSIGGALRMNGTTVTCSNYNWTAGAVDALNGAVFTANSLADNGIAGNFYINPGCEINLHNYQGDVDLKGNLYIYGGNFRVFGGYSESRWPFDGNASLTMTGGVLEFVNHGINIWEDYDVYTFTHSITGGTIKSSRDFTNHRNDFNPSAGTLELNGTINAMLSMFDGSLNNLTINKSGISNITLETNATVNGITTINNGTFETNNHILTTGNNININNGGMLKVEAGAQLRLSGSMALLVNEGGSISVTGTPGNPATVTRAGTSGYHEFQVNGGISARDAIFEYNYGINIWSTATIDPLNPFDDCTFQNGIDRFLLFSNSQELMIRGANFPTAPVYNNVWKNNDAGRINFRDATGAYAGEAYDLDPYNRIDWTTSQPGLWTGVVSTDWHTAGNWDDLVVPVAGTNVTIPAGLINMPVIGSATAYCNNLNINGQLTLSDRTFQVGGNVNISGNLTMNHYSGMMNVEGNINWNSGSTATFTANSIINLNGNWNFFSGSSAQLAMGSVLFNGTSTKNISCYSANSSLNDVYIEKSGGGIVIFNPASTYPLRSKGFYVSMEAGFTSSCSQNIIVKGNLYTFGLLTLNNGAVVLDGTDHLIIPNVNSYFNDLIFSQTGTASINNTNTGILHVKGSVTIESGVFDMQDRILKVERNWNNTAGPDAFNEGTGRVIFTGNYAQLCSTETFNILEIDKGLQYFYDQSESTIYCQVYDWTHGGIWIAGGSTFYAADLADDGVYGEYVLWGNSIELHQDAAQSVNLLGNISIHGGEFIMDGGNDLSRWGDYGNASLIMNTGVLDVRGYGLSIVDADPYSFHGNITGGTIRTNGNFITQSPGFNPNGGLVEFYGFGSPMMQASNGSAFYDVTVNMPDNFMGRVSVYPSVVKNNFIIEAGMAEVTFGSVLECRSNLEIHDGGWLALSSGTLSMGNLAAVNVFQNGMFSSFGYEGAMSVVKGVSSEDIYSLSVNSGGQIEAVYTVFENLPVQGVYIAPGAIVNPFYSFTDCEFRNSETGPSALISIENEQDIVIENAVFPANTWGGQNNVRKQFNQGSVTFINASGAFAGETFEDDPYNRIHWAAPKQLNLVLFLEGLYNGPYSMRQANDEYGPHFGAGIADQITVELHSAADYNTVVHLADHVNLSTEGFATLTVPASLSESYYITVRHRNSIATVSATPVSFANGSIFHIFNTPASAYGGNLLQMITGQYVIYGGDVNQDGVVDTGDMTPVDNDAANFTSGYLATDANGDGTIDTGDITIIDNNAAAFVGRITP